MQFPPHTAIPAPRAIVAKPLGQRRHAIARLLVAAREDHGAPGAGIRGETELLLEQRVRKREDDEVDRLADLGQRPDARQTQNLVVLGVHREDPAVEPALEQLDDALVADRSLAGAGTDDGDRSRLEHALERGSLSLRRHRGFLTARSLTAARYACQPGMPFTPPPAWVAEEPWYRPLIGVR